MGRPLSVSGRAVVLLVVTSLMVGWGVALASHDGPNVVHFCVKANGNVERVVDDPGDCKKRETSVDVAAAAAVDALQTEITALTQRVSDLEASALLGVYTVQGTTASGGASGNSIANCDAGDVATGGGIGGLDVTSTANRVTSSNPRPTNDGSEPTGWNGGFNGDMDPSDLWAAYVLCADFAPAHISGS